MEVFGYDLENIIYWHWWVIACAFFVLEVLTLSFFFLWIGGAAIIVGGILLIAPDMAWPLQLSLWAVISLAGALGWRVFKKNNPNPIKSDEPNLNRRGDQYVDRIFTLEEPIKNGFGKVKVDDSIWKVEAEKDLAAGKKVRVTAVDGTVLQVKEER